MRTKLYKIYVLFLLLIAVLIQISGCSEDSPSKPKTESPEADYLAPLADTAPTIDGVADEDCWKNADWAQMNFLWLGTPASENDISCRYKIVWTAEKLFVLVEAIDDVLSDTHSNPLVNYWDDDCVEFFIDEDASGGNHQNNHNAFAYHIALDYRAVDLGQNGQPREYTDNVDVKMKSVSTKHTWEIALDIYDDSYIDGVSTNKKVVLKENKLMGYAVAYCDADGKGYRENFYGSMDIPGADKNRAWQDASLFGKLLLVK